MVGRSLDRLSAVRIWEYDLYYIDITLVIFL